jgi:hypothetical protein
MLPGLRGDVGIDVCGAAEKDGAAGYVRGAWEAHFESVDLRWQSASPVRFGDDLKTDLNDLNDKDVDTVR